MPALAPRGAVLLPDGPVECTESLSQQEQRSLRVHLALAALGVVVALGSFGAGVWLLR